MTTHPFRFGIVATPPGDAAAWGEQLRRTEDLGYSTVLVPDTRFTAAPLLSLAAGAAATTSLHLSTWVLSTPNRAPGLVAWETATLDTLSGGRFELGLGAGRPGAGQDAEALGMSFGSPRERIEQVRQTIAAVDEWYAAERTTNAYNRRPGGQTRPTVMIAGAGPVMLRFAGANADIVALGMQPTAGEDVLADTVAKVREGAGGRDPEVALSLIAIGEQFPPWLEQMTGTTPAALAESGSVAVLQGSLDEMCDTLIRRREEFGVSYITINDAFTEALAPVVERLAGT